MKHIALVIFFILYSILILGQDNKGICNVEVKDLSKITSFGYLVGYTVQFKNNSKKTVDGIYWKVNYYNNNGDLVSSDESSFNSSEITDPIASGFTKSIIRAPRVKGASKAVVIINKVHFSDGSKCN